MSAPILVTGGAGFIGAHVTRQLLSRGERAVVLDNLAVASQERARLLEEEGAEFHHADVRDAQQMKELLAHIRPGTVMHLAALHFVPYCMAHPTETIETNVRGLQNLLDSLPDSVGRFVFASTGDVYKPTNSAAKEDDDVSPINVYGASKLMGEQLIRFWQDERAQAIALVLRLFNTYGPGETNPHVLPAICMGMRDGGVLLLGNTSPKRDYIYVDDVASVIVDAIESRHVGVANVGTGSAYSVAELIECIRFITGRELPVKTDPERLRKVERPHLQADTSRLDQWFPDRPRTRLEDGLRQLLKSQQLL